MGCLQETTETLKDFIMKVCALTPHVPAVFHLCWPACSICCLSSGTGASFYVRKLTVGSQKSLKDKSKSGGGGVPLGAPRGAEAGPAENKSVNPVLLKTGCFYHVAGMFFITL